MTSSKFVLISACRNEEGYLEGLIACIAAQSVLPERLLIVDDGSTDSTYGKACRLMERATFVSVVQTEVQRGRSFSSQVYAANHGFELWKKRIDLFFRIYNFDDDREVGGEAQNFRRVQVA